MEIPVLYWIAKDEHIHIELLEDPFCDEINIRYKGTDDDPRVIFATIPVVKHTGDHCYGCGVDQVFE